MLGLMRKHATSWLIKVALFAIVIVFIFWGGYSYTERRASRVAVVNGSYIGLREYQSAYNNLLEQMRRQLGNQFSSDILETLNLKDQALSQLINRRLLLEEAAWMKLDISREELQKAIRSYPAFQTNGQFDPQRYYQTLRFMRLTPQDFEANLHEDLLMDKVQRFITRGAKVLDTEMLSYFHHTRDKVSLDYVQIDPRKLNEQVELDEEALKSYFDEHRENYQIGAKRSIIYVRFPPGDYLQEAQTTDAEVEEFYRLHQEDYQEPEKVRASHILFRISPQAKMTDLQPVLEKAKKVLDLTRQGDDFAGLARKYSDDSTASNGGDLGYFTRNDMVKPFADAAFSMKKGEISDLVRTPFGLHIIKVEDIKEKSTLSLSEVRETVIQKLKKEGASEIALQRAELFIDETRALDDLRKAAAARGLEVHESGLFAANETIAQLGRYPEVNRVVFSLQPGEVSPVLEVGEDKVVAQLSDIQEPRLPDLTEVREKVEKDWVAEQSRILARKQAQDLLKTAIQKGGLAEAAKGDKLQIKETDLFTATSPAQPLGNQRDLVLAALALTPEQPVAPDVYEVSQSFVIIQLKDREPAAEEEFQKEKENIARSLLQLKKEQIFSRWVTARRQQSDIKILQEL
jgi:peptidyl-prolyl cis-trans isomerase D